ncbi:hypothetical protein [Mesorhizobium sp. B2-7-1]|uniref:hypothetical protein n=1 Tax=Mesorhizobium sp. B2-7-1 TaxID=2589909 RepID=UPI001AEE2F2A|nr:hypothetical protein [Mesorhizobium sp. B2-7-1]
MTGEPDLSGRVVLVVEDEYYIATDASRALQGAGAEVFGPFPSEEAARAEIAVRRPDAAVLDINLGSGPLFKLADTPFRPRRRFRLHHRLRSGDSAGTIQPYRAAAKAGATSADCWRDCESAARAGINPPHLPHPLER